MALYAIDDIDDAFDATRAFLLPFDWSRWLRLALIVFFLGGTGTGFNFQTGGDFSNVGTPSTPGSSVDVGMLDPNTIGAIILGVLAVVVVLVLVFIFIGSVMEFVFLESLRSEEVNIRQYFRMHWRAGSRLFGFRVVFGLVTLAIIALPIVAVIASLSSGDGPGLGIAVIFGAVLLLVPVLFLVGAIAGLIYGFTTVFVVPIMLIEERGVLSAWRRFWSTLRRQWKQYAGYVLVELGLSIAVGMAVLFVTFLVLAVVGIVFGLLAGIGFFVGGGFEGLSTAGAVVLALLGTVVGLAVLVALLLVQVPVQTYFRYYALLVLGDTNDAFDLIPDRRETIRTDEGETAASAN